MNDEDLEEVVSTQETEQVSDEDNKISDENSEEEENQVNNQSFEDDGAEENPSEDNDESKDKNQPDKSFKKELSKEERTKYAELRRETAKKEEIERNAYRKGLVEAVNGVNPYTNEEIKTEADIEEFINMREAQKEGYDPVSEYSKFLKNKRLKQSVTSDFDYKADKTEFETKYPDIDLEKLVGDVEFSSFADGLAGKIPLTKIYEKFQSFQAKLQAEIQKGVVKEMTKSKSSAGSLENKQERKSKSFEDMTDDEFEKMIYRAKNGGLSQ